MGAIAVRNLSERKLRTVLTSLAIVLGVMMVAGTYVLTDTIDRSFERIFTQSNEGVDAVVTSKENIETFEDVAPAVLRASVLKQVEAVDGVAAAEGSIGDQQVSIIGADGDPRGGNGAPSLGFSVSVPYSDRFDPLTYVEGGPPMSADEVVIDKASAEDEGFEVGDPVTIAGRAGDRRVHAQRDRDARRRRLVRRRDDRRPHPARGPAADRQGGRARPDLGRRRGGRLARPAGRVAAGGASGRPRRRDRRRERRVPARRHRRVHRLHQDGAADLRRHRAVRRRLPDLQHLLDHRRPAHPRVRDAAHARRLAPPDPLQRRARGGGDRLRRRRRRRCRSGSASRR